MAVRNSMTEIIQSIRELIGDTATAPDQQMISDQQIQDKLDLHRRPVVRVPLVSVPTYSNDADTNPAVVLYLDYYAPESLKGWGWETDKIEQDFAWIQITSVSFEPLAGHWVFSYLPTLGVLPAKSHAPGQIPPVMVSAKLYDINLAGYECCRLLLANVWKCAINVTQDGTTINQQQLITNIKEVMAECARNIKPKRIALVRSDAAGCGGGW